MSSIQRCFATVIGHSGRTQTIPWQPSCLQHLRSPPIMGSEVNEKSGSQRQRWYVLQSQSSLHLGWHLTFSSLLSFLRQQPTLTGVTHFEPHPVEQHLSSSARATSCQLTRSNLEP